MKYFAVVLLLSLCTAGVHAASEKMTSWGFDLVCPHSSDICNCACQSWGYTSGECQGLGNSQCWCFYFRKKPSLGGKKKMGK